MLSECYDQSFINVVRDARFCVKLRRGINWVNSRLCFQIAHYRLRYVGDSAGFIPNPITTISGMTFQIKSVNL